MNPVKEFEIENPELYEEAKREAFKELIMECVESYLDSFPEGRLEPTVESFQDDTDIEFDFHDRGRWYEIQYNNKYDESQEDKMEYKKDIDMGLR